MTLSALGIFSAAGAGGIPFASDYELITTTILGSSQASVVFSSLGIYSSTYKHLQLRMTRTNPASVASTNYLDLRMNNVTTGSYSGHVLFGNGSTVGSNAGNGTSSTSIYGGAQGISAASLLIAAGQIIDFLDFSSSTKNKTIRSFSGYIDGSAMAVELISGQLISTTPITSIELSNQGAANFGTGSRFSLYGIKG